MKQVKPNFLVLIGEDIGEEAEILKIYNMDKIDSKTEEFQLVKSYQIFPKGTKMVSPVTCLEVNQDFSSIALGLGNGSIILYQGDLARGRSSVKLLNAISKEPQPITGMSYKKLDAGWCLFCSTASSTYRYIFTPKGIDQSEMEQLGNDLGCSTLSHDGDYVVARKDGVWFFKPEGKGQCYAFEGKKMSIQWFRTYLIVVSSEYNKRNVLEQSVTIYDLVNRYIAYKFPVDKAQVMQVLQEWGFIFVIVQDRKDETRPSQKMFQFTEKDTQTKLDILFQKNHFKIAIDLVKSQQLDTAYVIDIFCKFGDHLYSKKKYDDAMDQYIRTIGKLEPSYVIRKYLDAQRIHNLTNYLETLHEAKLATSDHTTLLLNCYTKLKDTKKEKLDKFIKGTNDKEAAHYDIETAIRVCRQVGYVEVALDLAKKHKEHDWFLKIQIEDLKDDTSKKNYRRALKHIETLDHELAAKYLKIYGRILVSILPKQTTNVLIRLCTAWIVTSTKEKNRALKRETTGPQARTEDFMHCFASHPEWLVVFLEAVTQRRPKQPKIVYNTLFELFIRFLETPSVDLSTPVQEKYNYDIPAIDDSFAKKSNKEKVLYLIDQGDSNYDTEHILVLVQTYGFREGILKMYERLNLYNDIIQYFMEQNDYYNIIQTCLKNGSDDRNMWIQVLSFFANGDLPFESEIQTLLNRIEKDDILPPLMVIQILSKKKTTLGTLKEYLTKRLGQEQSQINEDLEHIKINQDETGKMRSELEQLKTTAKIFQVATCTYCSSQLDLPSVHFMCGHSFHQRCLTDVDDCSACSKKHRDIAEKKSKYDEGTGNHEAFFTQLKNNQNNGFFVVSEYFGRGIFKQHTDLDESAVDLNKSQLFD